MGLYRESKALLEDLVEKLNPPDSNCSCHISYPCNDCVDHSYERELRGKARILIKKLEAALLIAPDM